MTKTVVHSEPVTLNTTDILLKKMGNQKHTPCANRRNSQSSLLWILPLLVLWITCTSAVHYPDPGPDIAGDYCRRRQGEQCCPGRDDYCTVPILDSVCYCDLFCNRTISDCCPDFWGLCMGISPPVGAQTPPPTNLIINNCVHDGKQYKYGDQIYVNCNNCTCVEAVMKKELNWKCTQKICLVREEIIQRVNSASHQGWRAGNYSFLWGMTLDEGVRYRLGTFRPVDPVKRMTALRVHINDVLPQEFDSRTEWPGLIHRVQDQGDCGASWAFSTTSMAADRLSIHSSGALKEVLSAQNLLSCNKDYMQKGCQGGHLDRAWWYMRRIGVVTEQCYPYQSGESGQEGTCLVPPRHHSATQRVTCPSRSTSSRLYQASPPYRIAPIVSSSKHDTCSLCCFNAGPASQTVDQHWNNTDFTSCSCWEREIMKEILDNGPVQATMEVKEDFYMYQSGVYRYAMPASTLPPNHPRTGFHSVRILGWGIDHSYGRPIKYWLCANSWGPNWGEDGYFRIVRGADECKIESFVVGVWAKVNGRLLTNRRVPDRQRRHNTQRHRPSTRTAN